MSSDYVTKLISLIDQTKLKKILRLMQNNGVSQPGFSKLENVPVALLVNSCSKNSSIRNEFLNCTVFVYIGKRITPDEEAFVEADKLPGLIAQKILENNDGQFDDFLTSCFVTQQKSDIVQTDDLTNIDINEESKDMRIFLGYMDSYDETFYNFYPLYENINGKFNLIENAESVFPNHGNFAIFKSRGYDVESQIKKREFCVLKLEDTDIQPNTNYITGEFNTSHYKLNLEDLVNHGKLIKLSDYNIYPIVTAEKSYIDFSKDSIIDVEEDFPVFKYMTQSVLYYNGEYYGPFETGFRDYNRKVYLNTKIHDRKYVINKYSIYNNEDDPVIYCKYYKSDREPKDFLILTDDLKKEVVDCISDEALIKDFTNSISSFGLGNSSISFEDLSKVIKDLQNTSLTDISEHPEISEKRIAKLKKLLANVSSFKDLAKDSSNIVSLLLSQNIDDGEISELLEKIISSPEFLGRIQNYKIVSSKIDEEKYKLEELQKQCKELEENIAQQKEETYEKILSETEEKKVILDNLSSSISEKEQELDIISKKLNLSSKIDELEVIYNHSYNKVETLNRKIDTKIEEAKNSLAEISFNNQFDKLISRKLSDALASLEKDADSEKYINASTSAINAKVSQIEDENLVDYVVSEIQKYRPKYDRNTIINLLVCFTQGFFTILSGAPGTGKTSICKILAHILGLDSSLSTDNVFSQRFVTVPVERGWNSKRDLIGYYNPLSRKVEKNNTQLYDALRILDCEREHSKIPMLILLDEANLSPMEFYWGDFLNICDSINSNSRGNINLGEDLVLNIPKTLRFWATINNDHTTEKLSPRLIDRAFVISLPFEYSDSANTDIADSDNEPIEWAKLERCFTNTKTVMQRQSINIFENIISIFKKMNQDISPRLINSVRSYCSVAQNLFESEMHSDPSIIALDYAVAQKVITKISGHGNDYKERLIELNDYCKNENLNLTAKQLDRIIDEGDRAMGYYEFFN